MSTCIRGHERTPENLRPNGRCRTCHNALRRKGQPAEEPGRALRRTAWLITQEQEQEQAMGRVVIAEVAEPLLTARPSADLPWIDPDED